ncbi:MAG: adenosylmethionine--8-amino-7-oxononanoate transaminase [Planctomycetaceae bacterium]
MTPEQLRQVDSEIVWHPFTAMQAHAREQPPIIAAAEGFELIDLSGRRYLDGTSSLWCNIHGHRVPAIDDAIRRQLDRVAHTTLLGLGNLPSIEFARQLVDVTPAGLNHVFYSDDGSTAVEAALKIALQYYRQRSHRREERSLYVSLDGAYHGDTIGAVSVGGIDLFHGIYGELLFRKLTVPSPSPRLAPPGVSAADHFGYCLTELERTLRQHRHEIAAFLIEPRVQAAAGILVHPPGYLRRLRELTWELDILLIADEVATGFGRTGPMWACDHEAVAPDMLCLSKGITGGYLPLGATLTTTPIDDAVLGEPGAGKTVFHGHTFTGNPLACAAGLASLELLETNRVLDNVSRLGMVLARRLAALNEHPHVGDIRRCGLMVGIELVQDRATGTPFPPERRTGHRVTLAARQRGVIIRPLGDVVVLMPAPGMPEALLERLCDATFAAIDEAVAEV